MNIDAPLTLFTVGPDGRMPDPAMTEFGIYDFAPTGIPGVGGMPGRGNTVVAGNNGNAANPGVLRRFTPAQGDEIRLDINGIAFSYRIVAFCLAQNSQFTAIVGSGFAESLTLIQGAGGNTRAYVVAERQPNSLPRSCPAGEPIQRSPNDQP
jgi:hypothetical protein